MAYPPQPPAPAPAPGPAPAPVPAVFQQPALAPVAPAPAAPPAAAPASAPVGDPGFPANTPLEQMTVEQREAYWKHQARKHENTVKNELPELQRQAQELAALKAATQTDQEKAIEVARAEGRALALKEASKQLVAAHFTAATPGLSEQDRQELLAGLSDTYFLAADGVSVDTAKVTAYAARFAPAATATPPGRFGATPPRPDLGQGRFPPTARPSGMEAGRALARQKFGQTPAPGAPTT